MFIKNDKCICKKNKIKGVLDLSGLKKLDTVKCTDNKITRIKVGKRGYGLDVSRNNIREVLDLSHLSELYWYIEKTGGNKRK